jgi:dTDP-4-amino-4,6-dideoxygalactose transaminase
MKKIPLIKPHITEEVKAKVCEVLDSGYLTEGPVTAEFVDRVKDYVGSQYALAVSNCTVGLEMALRALGIGPGDEVIVPDYTYPATGAVVQIVGAKVVIVDIDSETALIDYDALEQAITPKTKAVIPVSLFGNPVDYDRLYSIKDEYDIFVVKVAWSRPIAPSGPNGWIPISILVWPTMRGDLELNLSGSAQIIN